MTRFLVWPSIVVVALLVTGCERDERPTIYKKGEYQGKRDMKPWDNQPNEWSRSAWNAGDRASWEAAIRQRNLNQNEYLRTQ